MELSARQRTSLLIIALSSAMFVILVLLAELSVGASFARYLLISFLLVGLVFALAVLIKSFGMVPKEWKHRFVPQYFEDSRLSDIVSKLDAEPSRETGRGMQERITAVTWAREILLEKVELSQRLSTAGLQKFLKSAKMHEYVELPGELEYIPDFLARTEDLGLYDREDSVVLLQRSEFLPYLGETYEEARRI